MYEGPTSPGLTLLHIGAQFPALTVCAGLAAGAYIFVTPRTDPPAALPDSVEATKLYDGVTGKFLTLADLAKENLDPDTYVSPKGLQTKRCYVVYDDDGQCHCQEIPFTK